MGGDAKRLVVAFGGACLLLLGSFSTSWWTATTPDTRVRVGLTSAKVCDTTGCRRAGLDQVGAGGQVFKVTRAATFYLGLLLALGCLLVAFGRESITSAMLLKIGALGYITAIVLGQVAHLALPADWGLSLSWGFFAFAPGAGLGAWAILRDAVDLPAARPSQRQPRKPVQRRALSTAAEANAPLTAVDALAQKKLAKRQRTRRFSMAERAKRFSETPTPDPGPTVNETMTRHQPAQPLGLTGEHTSPRIQVLEEVVRFAANAVVISDEGLSWLPNHGTDRFVEWTEIKKLTARRLPPDPPYNEGLFLDVVPKTEGPLRLLTTAVVNYTDLPGGARASARENMQHLAQHIQEKNPAVIFEGESLAFFLEGKLPPKFLALKQFDEYDSQFDIFYKAPEDMAFDSAEFVLPDQPGPQSEAFHTLPDDDVQDYSTLPAEEEQFDEFQMFDDEEDDGSTLAGLGPAEDDEFQMFDAEE